jgi:hypothetical protein
MAQICSRILPHHRLVVLSEIRGDVDISRLVPLITTGGLELQKGVKWQNKTSSTSTGLIFLFLYYLFTLMYLCLRTKAMATESLAWLDPFYTPLLSFFWSQFVPVKVAIFPCNLTLDFPDLGEIRSGIGEIM